MRVVCVCEEEEEEEEKGRSQSIFGPNMRLFFSSFSCVIHHNWTSGVSIVMVLQNLNRG